MRGPALTLQGSNQPCLEIPIEATLQSGGEIYKMELDGTIIGRFGTAGKMIGQFGTVNGIDCREENDLLVGELGNWRVQRVTLQPM